MSKNHHVNEVEIMFCPKCGTKLAQEVKFCPSCGAAVLPIDTDVDTDATEENAKAGFKYCARCNKKNHGSEKICRSCGLPFGTIVKGVDNKLRVTCEGCGSVYELKKNKAYIITMFAIAAISSLIYQFNNLFLLVGIITGICGLVHLCGGMKKKYIKKCSVCMRTPEQVEQDAAQDAKLLKLIEKRKNPLVKKPDYDNPLVSKKPVYNFTPWLSLAALVLFFVSLFIPGDLTRTSMDIISRTEVVAYGDAMQILPGFVVLMYFCTQIFSIVACITNFKTKARWAGVGLVSGIVASACTFLLFISNFTLSSFTYQETKVLWGERITTTVKASYSVGVVNLLLFVSFALFAVAAVLGYYIERENRYKRWYVKNHPSVK